MKPKTITIATIILLLFNESMHSQQPFMVKDINPGNSGSLQVPHFTGVNNLLFFNAMNGTSGFELWKSDGTNAGTVMVKDIFPGIPSGIISNSIPTSYNSTLYFNANNGLDGIEPWKSDGTETGTVMIKNINTNNNFNSGHSNPSLLTNVNGTIFFRAFDEINGWELWKCDGTNSGTTMVKDINPGNLGNNPASSFPTHLTNINGTLFFGAFSPVFGNELWKSDGTSAGTVMVREINSNVNITSGNSELNFLTNVNGTLFFTTNDGINGFELWKSDGTAIGTVLVKDIFPGYNIQDNYAYSSDPRNLTNINGTLFFSARDQSNSNFELWKSDGTTVGTVKVREICAGNNGSDPTGLTNVNGTLYFSANDGINGMELWKSNGTENSTIMIKDLYSGAIGSAPAEIININGSAYFTANDGNGKDLFKTDGTAGGTVDYNLSNPGYGGPSTLINLSGKLYFTLFTDLHGRELWVLDINSLSTSENILNDNKFLIFPNPANNILTIQNVDNKPVDKITISDLTGKKVLEQNNNSTAINLEKL